MPQWYAALIDHGSGSGEQTPHAVFVRFRVHHVSSVSSDSWTGEFQVRGRWKHSLAGGATAAVPTQRDCDSLAQRFDSEASAGPALRADHLWSPRLFISNLVQEGSLVDAWHSVSPAGASAVWVEHRMRVHGQLLVLHKEEDAGLCPLQLAICVVAQRPCVDFEDGSLLLDDENRRGSRVIGMPSLPSGFVGIKLPLKFRPSDGTSSSADEEQGASERPLVEWIDVYASRTRGSGGERCVGDGRRANAHQEAILRSADATQRPVLTAQIYLERITDERHYRVPLPPLPEEPSAGLAARGIAKQEAEAAAKRATAQRAAAEDRASDASLPAWSASAGPDAGPDSIEPADPSVDLDASDVWSVGSAPTQRTPLLSAAIESQLEAERAAWPEHRDVHLRLDVVSLHGVSLLDHAFTAEVFVELVWRDASLGLQVGVSPERAAEVLQTVLETPALSERIWRAQLNLRNLMHETDAERWYEVRVDPEDRKLAIVSSRARLTGIFREHFELHHFPVDAQDLALDLMVSSSFHGGEVRLQLNRALQSPLALLSADVVHDEYVLAPHIFYQPARSGYVCPAKRFATKGGYHRVHREMNEDCCGSRPVWAATPGQAGGSLSAAPSDGRVPAAALRMSMRLARRSSYYTTHVALPLFMITSALSASFWVDPMEADVSSRLSITLVLLLTISTFRDTVNAIVPRINYATAIDGYFSLSLVLATVTIVQNVTANLLKHFREVEDDELWFDHDLENLESTVLDYIRVQKRSFLCFWVLWGACNAYAAVRFVTLRRTAAQYVGDCPHYWTAGGDCAVCGLTHPAPDPALAPGPVAAPRVFSSRCPKCRYEWRFEAAAQEGQGQFYRCPQCGNIEQGRPPSRSALGLLSTCFSRRGVSRGSADDDKKASTRALALALAGRTSTGSAPQLPSLREGLSSSLLVSSRSSTAQGEGAAHAAAREAGSRRRRSSAVELRTVTRALV